MTVSVDVERKVLSENDRIAGGLRQAFSANGVLCLNFISAPGSGKTALLERTLRELPQGTRAAVVTGDLQTDNDARRLARAGFPVKQITTGGTCHLDATMVVRAIEGWPLDEIDVLFVENVGNLVCPSSFDLGEHAKVVLLSVTEGEDKSEKYPGIFRRAELALITKSDLLPYVEFDVARARALAQHVHPGLTALLVSSRTGEGMEEWQSWLAARRVRATAAHAEVTA